MRAMMVKIGFEIEQLAFEIGGCPEKRTIQAVSRHIPMCIIEGA
jgi:hypothetical protein